MALRFVLLIISLIVLTNGSKHTLTVSKENPGTLSLSPMNLKTKATLKLDSSVVPLLLCLQAVYPVPNYASYSDESCTFYRHVASPKTSFEFPLRALKYNLGVYFAKSSEESMNATVVVNVEGDVCPPGQVYNSEQCVALRGSLKPGSNQFSLLAGEKQYFSLNQNTDLLASASLSFVSSLNDSVALDYAFRYEGTPAYQPDFTTASVASPSVGTWYVEVSTKQGPSGSLNTGILTLSTKTCAKGNATLVYGGSDCTVPVKVAGKSMLVGAVSKGEFQYYQVLVSDKTALFVSLSTLVEAEENPTLLASKGQLPTPQNAELTNCNQQFCSSTVILKLNESTGNETWYVAVTGKGANATQYGIWFNSVCPPGCEAHGSCTESGNMTGQCVCITAYVGLDCSITDSLPSQYIVLIIIASLVVVSALIGFVAWAYMKRKRVDYEIVPDDEQ